MLEENYLLPLKNLPPLGQEFTTSETELFTSLISEFSLSCRLNGPIEVQLSLLPSPDGLLVRGKLTGQVLVPCRRCAEDSAHSLLWEFDRFESYPDPDTKKPSDFTDDSRIILDKKLNYILDLRALLGEEFMLALPSDPLCKEDCRGLCPHCGTNLNEHTCNCQKETLDPRLAVFRSLKLQPKS